MAQEASLVEVKNFFEFTSMEQFRTEWNKLNDAEKTFFKVEVGKEIHKED